MNIDAKIILLILCGTVSGCESLVQLQRDNLRYSTYPRGEETYSTGSANSVEAMKAVSEANGAFFENYLEALKNNEPDRAWRFFEIDRNRQMIPEDKLDRERQRDRSVVKASAPSTSSKSVTAKTGSGKASELQGQIVIDSGVLATALAQTGAALTQAPNVMSPKIFIDGGHMSYRYGDSSQIEGIWPKAVFNATQTTTTKFGADQKPTEAITQTTQPGDNLVKAISSTASIAQMRDLMTEPSFPSLVPVSRTVRLGCLPPSDNVVFESLTALKAAVDRKDKDDAIRKIVEAKAADGTVPGNSTDTTLQRDRQLTAELSANSQSFAVKAVEETQKTWFLQWALFRLCEVSLNSGDMRNTVPIVIHDIVRRTAEMSNDAEASVATRVQAQEETRKAQIEKETAQVNLDLAKQQGVNAQAIASAEKEKQFTACQQSLYGRNKAATFADVKAECTK